jgi:predicted nucleotidyltransferase
LNPLPEHHVAALREIRRLWPESHIIVIGASAVACHIGLSWRGTIDLDLSIAAALQVCDRKLESLGWRRRSGAPQRWTTPTGALVDVVPAARPQVRRGGFEWPDGGAAMSLVGFRLAFADAVPLAIGPRFKVRIASLRSLVLLKMAAYFDRPRERDNDLGDIAQILSWFLPDDAPTRWSDQVVELGMDYEDVGPYLLGQEIGGVADAA